MKKQKFNNYLEKLFIFFIYIMPILLSLLLIYKDCEIKKLQLEIKYNNMLEDTRVEQVLFYEDQILNSSLSQKEKEQIMRRIEDYNGVIFSRLEDKEYYLYYPRR
jgi:hypothetical protein